MNVSASVLFMVLSFLAGAVEMETMDAAANAAVDAAQAAVANVEEILLDEAASAEADMSVSDASAPQPCHHQ